MFIALQTVPGSSLAAEDKLRAWLKQKYDSFVDLLQGQLQAPEADNLQVCSLYVLALLQSIAYAYWYTTCFLHAPQLVPCESCDGILHCPGCNTWHHHGADPRPASRCL